MGAYVSLLEYNNIEGMILFSELSRRRIRSISSLIKVGRQEPSMVLRVDRDKGYIDLSKRRVSEEEAATCEDRYNKSKLVHSIMRHAADTLGVDLEPLYQRIAWPLYRRYGHAFEAFKLIVTDPDGVLDVLTYEETVVGPDGEEVTKVVPAVTPEVKDALVKNIRRRMTPQPLKIRADVEMKCFQFDGVLHIKVLFASIHAFWFPSEAMRKAEAAGNADCPVKIKLVAPPLYVLTTQTLDKVGYFFHSFIYPCVEYFYDARQWVLWIHTSHDANVWLGLFIMEGGGIRFPRLYERGWDQGIAVLTNATKICAEAIEKHKGKLVVKEAARAVSERDDKLFADTIEKLKLAGEEVDGDDDSEEEDSGMGDVDFTKAGAGAD
uniref:Eukaryotic translation initiation factor 2 subunit alpha n=1 Tax=Aegilops tauschii TaxID=37682 RepID=M8BTU8_AEGTA